MDIATIIGLIGGTVLILSAIVLGGSAVMFLNIPGILIVVGGTLAACFIKFSMADVIRYGRNRNRHWSGWSNGICSSQ